MFDEKCREELQFNDESDVLIVNSRAEITPIWEWGNPPELWTVRRRTKT